MHSDPRRIRAAAIACPVHASSHRSATPSHRPLRAPRRLLACGGALLAAALLVGAAQADEFPSGVASVELDVFGAEPQQRGQFDQGFDRMLRVGAVLPSPGGECIVYGAADTGRGAVLAQAHAFAEGTVGAQESVLSVATATSRDRFKLTFGAPLERAMLVRFSYHATGLASYDTLADGFDALGECIASYNLDLVATGGTLAQRFGVRHEGLVVDTTVAPPVLESISEETGLWGDQQIGIVVPAGLDSVTFEMTMSASALASARSTLPGNEIRATTDPTVEVRWGRLVAITDQRGVPYAGTYLADSESGFNYVRPEDLDFDGSVGAGDLARLLGSWGSGDVGADINQDGAIDGQDIARLLQQWGA